jgi:ABC-type branched-subunit amino acid transport system substrate-binding protein
MFASHFHRHKPRHRVMTRIFALLVALSLSLGTLHAAEGVTVDTITIGQSAPLTGPSEELGREMKAGAEAAFAAVNEAGGIGGRKLKLITLDDANDPERTKANTQKLINEEKVLALFGYVGAHTVTPILPVVDKSKVPLIGPMSGDTNLRDSVLRYVYPTRASYVDEAEQLVSQLAARKLTKVAIFYQSDVSGRAGLAAADYVMRKHKLNMVLTGQVARGSTNVESVAQSLSKSNADAVIIAAGSSTAAALIKQMRKLGSTAQFALFSTAGGRTLVNALGEDARGVAVSQVVPLPTSEAEPLGREYLKRIGGASKASFASLEGYIAARVLIEGIKKAGKVPTRESLVDGLDKVGTLDLNGFRLAYSPINHAGTNFVELTVVGAGGNYKR